MPRSAAVKAYKYGQETPYDPSKPIKLTQVQFARTVDVLRGEIREYLMDRQPSYAEAAQEASKHTDFTLTEENIKKVNAYAQVWEPKLAAAQPGYRQNTTAVMARLEQLEQNTTDLQKLLIKQGEQLTKLSSENAHLRMLISHLYYELNTKPPAGVTLPPREKTISVVNK